MAHTKVDAELARAEARHADDPERAELIRRARVFKASWVDLAEALTDVRRRGVWKRWGHESFEAYAKSELKLRAETVEKLVGSFAFLKRSAPDVLRRDGVSAPIPHFQSVDFLRRAEAEERAPRDLVDALRHRVLDEGAPIAAISRQFRDAVFPPTDEQRSQREAAALRNVAARLRDLVGESAALPGPLSDDLLEALDRLLAWLERAGERAA